MGIGHDGRGSRRSACGPARVTFSMNLTGPDPYSVSAGWARRVVEQLLAEERVRPPLLLNVNLQAEEPLEIRLAPTSLVTGVQSYDRRVSPGRQVYLWHERSAPEDRPLEGVSARHRWH